MANSQRGAETVLVDLPKEPHLLRLTWLILEEDSSLEHSDENL